MEEDRMPEDEKAGRAKEDNVLTNSQDKRKDNR